LPSALATSPRRPDGPFGWGSNRFARHVVEGRVACSAAIVAYQCSLYVWCDGVLPAVRRWRASPRRMNGQLVCGRLDRGHPTTALVTYLRDSPRGWCTRAPSWRSRTSLRARHTSLVQRGEPTVRFVVWFDACVSPLGSAGLAPRSGASLHRGRGGNTATASGPTANRFGLSSTT